MENSIMTVVAVGAVIQLIFLIVFFVMASNVSKIRKHLVAELQGKRYFEIAQEEIYIGNKDKAKEYLLRAKYRYEVMEENYYVNGELSPPSIIIKKIDKLLSEL